MTMQYAIVGGQLKLDKAVFAKEMLVPDSTVKKLLKTEESIGARQPQITKTGQSVTIDYNDASDVYLDEGFYDLFKNLKMKYKEKVTGRVVIRITALTSYHVILDLNCEDGRIVYE